MKESQFPAAFLQTHPQDMPSNSGVPGGLTTELLSIAPMSRQHTNLMQGSTAPSTHQLRSSSSSSSSSGIGHGDDRHGHESATLFTARPGPHVATEAAFTTDARAAAKAR